MPKKPAKDKSSAKPSNSLKKDNLSKQILSKNHFAQQKEQDKAAAKTTSNKPLKPAPKKNLGQWFKKRRQKRLLKKDAKLKKRAAYLSNLPSRPHQRFFYRLHPKRVLGFIFSWRVFWFFLKVGILLILIGGGILVGLYLHYRQDVPVNITSLQSCIKGQTTKYYDSSGKIILWESKSNIDCQPVQLKNVSPYLKDALLTTEDRDFYEHSGIEYRAILRALINNIRNEKTQGGSTITQQYIKNAILKDSSRTLDRKIKEIILAIEIERVFEKDEILTAYLNTVSFGSIYNGVEAASKGYFDKPAADLTLDEAALLVAALPAPTTFWKDSSRHLQRQKWVLSEMLETQKITQAQYEAALKVDTFSKLKTSHKQYEKIKAPHFILEAEKRLTEELCGLRIEEETIQEEEPCPNIRQSGYKVITTLDMSTQTLAEETIKKVMPSVLERDFDNAALVAVDVQTGKVLAQVGSRDFSYKGFGQTNTVTQLRDPGSTFKIFDYGALIEQNNDWGAGSILYDYATTFDNRGWTPKNYSGLHAGPITVRRALGQSLNIPAIKAMYIAGMENVHRFAEQAGIRSKLPCEGGCGLSSAFGGGAELRLDELTNAYATFSRGGQYMPLSYINQVYNSEGKLLKQWRPRPEQIFKNETAYILNHILADKTARFTQTFNLDPSVQTTMALKTGTDDFFVNNHIVAYSKSVAMGAWIGHHDESTKFETERNTNEPKSIIIKNFMENYHRDIPYEKKNHWIRPAGIQNINIDLLTGYQVTQNTDQTSTLISPKGSKTDIFPSWYIPQTSSQLNAQTVPVNSEDGRVVTDCQPGVAVQTLPAFLIRDELPIDDSFYENWQRPILKEFVSREQVAALTKTNTASQQCSDNLPQIQIVQKPDVCSDNCQITFQVTAGQSDLKEVRIYNNDQLLDDGILLIDDKQDQTLTYNYRPSTDDESHNLRLEVIDEQSYTNQINLTLNTDSQTVFQPPSNQLQLISAHYDRQRQTISLIWNQPAVNLRLQFGQNCQNQPAIYITEQTTSLQIDAKEFPVGDCQFYLIDNANQQSNQLTVNINQDTIIN